MKKIALIPLVLNFGDENFSGPWDRKFYDPGYGVFAHPQDFHKAMPRYHQPEPEEFWNHRKNWREIETRKVAPLKRESQAVEGFQVCMDVHQFAPHEITVKTVDQAVVVEAQHEERADRLGYISRHFRRRYILPEEYRVQDVVAMLSIDGVLVVKAKPNSGAGAELSNEKDVHIYQTGPANVHAPGKANKTNPKVNGTKGKRSDIIEEDFDIIENVQVGGDGPSSTKN